MNNDGGTAEGPDGGGEVKGGVLVRLAEARAFFLMLAALLLLLVLFDQLSAVAAGLLLAASIGLFAVFVRGREAAPVRLKSRQPPSIWPETGVKRMADALRYILQSMHFGIYLFVAAEGHLRPPNIGLLRQIGRAKGGNERKVVFIGGTLTLPDNLEEVTEHLSFERVMPQRPRLSDGRWVI